MIEWKPSWQGETVFHDESGEIRLSITPKPNRAVFFDARISHAGRAPSRSCPALRVSVAFKLQAIEECETATSEAQPVEITEQTRDGAHREYRIHARADFLEGRIRDRLQELGKTIKLPGFRSGRIPLTVLQSRYGERTRAQIIERIGSEAAERILAGGGLPASLQLTGGAESGDVEFLIAVTHLPDLPNVECESWKLERLTASESAAQRAGLSADEAKHLLSQVLHQEVLDYLHAAYSFPVASVLVERELARIRKAAAETQPDVNSETESVLAELREIAERRVRLGALLAELARRHHLAAGNDKPAIEGRVLDWLIARAQVTERPVTAEELRELDE
jgi:hypothetical protein